MSGIWDDRLAQVWAAPGKAGAGVVIGAETVLTARHVVAGALEGGRVEARVVRPGAATPGWVPMVVLAEDPAWDMAVLGVEHGKETGGSLEWLKPSSQLVFADVGTSTEPGCEAVGFPESEVQGTPQGGPAAAVRQTEQVRGTLDPAGQAKTPRIPGHALPRRWMPLDVDGPVPETQAGWGGMSGAAVVLPDRRLVGIVVDAEADHQQRRLYVVPLADVLAQSPLVADALSAALGRPVVAEARDAPLYRDILQDQCLGPDGLPVRVGEASFRAFGVKAAGIPGESAFLDYVPRDRDQELRDGMQRAQAEGRILLLVGGSAGGKSRSAAEAAQQLLGGHRLLCPRPTSLARLRELPVADLGPAVVWLDDAERYDELAFRDIVDWLRQRGVSVVATIRRTELEKRMPTGDYRSPLGEALADRELVVWVDWPVIWKEGELARVSQHVRYPPLLWSVAAGNSPSAWIVAGPALEARLRSAESDDERPARYALVRAVLDWHRTGITRPCPRDTVIGLLHAYLPGEPGQAEVDEAFRWALESVIGASRTTSQALLAEASAGDAVTVHDFIQDADARAGGKVVPDDVLAEVLRQAATDDERGAVGVAAAEQESSGIACEALVPLASMGNSPAAYNLGVLFSASNPDQAIHWFERAARAGHISAMHNLGVVLMDRDLGQAIRWFETAARAGHTRAMTNLGNLLVNSDPEQALYWLETAANAGDPVAMNNLGVVLLDRDPAQGRRWLEQAAEANYVPAMIRLGNLLKASDPEQARYWFGRAAEAGGGTQDLS